MTRLTEPVIDEREAEAARKVLESGWLVEGEVTRRFEHRVAEYVGASHAVATCNCTVALELCLKALNIKGEVVIPAFTHPATAQAVFNAGATPVFIDVDLGTYNIKPQIPSCDAVIPVSWGGNPLSDHLCFCGAETQWIQDAACSLGSEFAGKKTGWNGTTCFSFHPRKIVTCAQGGMVTTNSASLAAKIRDLKNFGEDGGNYKFDDVRAAIGVTQMSKIDGIIEKRIKMAVTYNDLLGNVEGVKPPQKHPLAKHTYQTYAVYLERGDRDKAILKLAEKNIETQVGAYALHLLPQFKNVKRVGALTNSEFLHRNLLALPMAHSMTDEDQKRVVTELKEVLNSG